MSVRPQHTCSKYLAANMIVGRLFSALVAAILQFVFVGALFQTSLNSAATMRRPLPFGAEYGSDGFRTVAFLLDASVEEERQQPGGALFNNVLINPITLDAAAPPALDSLDEAEQLNPEDAARGDPSQAEEYERLRDIYFAQIHARVERAWERPAKLLAENSEGQCVALVLQDTNGHVLEIELADCPTGLGLEQSIVSAVHRASPLPAPPQREVFSARVRIAFDLTRSADVSGEEAR